MAKGRNGDMEKLQILVVKHFNGNNVDEFDSQRPRLENTALCSSWAAKGSNSVDTNVTNKVRIFIGMFWYQCNKQNSYTQTNPMIPM